MGSIDGIAYKDLKGSGDIRVSEGTASGTRLYLVDWDNSVEFCKKLVSTERYVSGPYVWSTRYVHTWDVGGYTLGCTEAKITGVGKIFGGESFKYPKARITAEYAEIDNSWDADTYDIEGVTLDATAEFLALPKGTWKYLEGEEEVIIEESTGKLVCFTEHTRTLHRLKKDPMNTIRACIGKINADVWLGAARGTVLFLGGSTTKTWTSAGQTPFSLVMKFKEKPINWNYVMGKDGVWHLVHDTLTGEKRMYEYADFNALSGLS